MNKIRAHQAIISRVAIAVPAAAHIGRTIQRDTEAGERHSALHRRRFHPGQRSERRSAIANICLPRHLRILMLVLRISTTVVTCCGSKPSRTSSNARIVCTNSPLTDQQHARQPHLQPSPACPERATAASLRSAHGSRRRRLADLGQRSDGSQCSRSQRKQRAGAKNQRMHCQLFKPRIPGRVRIVASPLPVYTRSRPPKPHPPARRPRSVSSPVAAVARGSLPARRVRASLASVPLHAQSAGSRHSRTQSEAAARSRPAALSSPARRSPVR